MDINIKTWLIDIKQSIDEIFDFLGERRDFFAYKKDLKTKKAVERNLEIIGEAVNRILKTDKNFHLEEAKSIIGTRNRIIHSYDNISDEVIWTIVSRDLPKLKIQVESHLKDDVRITPQYRQKHLNAHGRKIFRPSNASTNQHINESTNKHPHDFRYTHYRIQMLQYQSVESATLD